MLCRPVLCCNTQPPPRSHCLTSVWLIVAHDPSPNSSEASFRCARPAFFQHKSSKTVQQRLRCQNHTLAGALTQTALSPGPSSNRTRCPLLIDLTGNAISLHFILTHTQLYVMLGTMGNTWIILPAKGAGVDEGFEHNSGPGRAGLHGKCGVGGVKAKRFIVVKRYFMSKSKFWKLHTNTFNCLLGK